VVVPKYCCEFMAMWRHISKKSGQKIVCNNVGIKEVKIDLKLILINKTSI
jgi:hypothetical protein